MEQTRRYTFFLKDGRVASADGVRLDPNVDRIFQGQMRNFITVSNGEIETAVFLSSDVLGWTVTIDSEEAALKPGLRLVNEGEAAPRTRMTGSDSLRAFLDS
jgi:hypothetical protein